MPNDEHLLNNEEATWSRWAQSFQGKGDWAGTLAVYDKQRKSSANPEHAETNIRYCVQEWARAEAEANGTDAAEMMLGEQIIRFQDVEDIEDVATSDFQRLVKKLADEENYDEAQAAAKRAAVLPIHQADAAALSEMVYDVWATSFSDKGEWQQAIDVYASGIKEWPNSEHLKQNAVATWHQWAKIYLDKEDWQSASSVYENALKQFPDEGTLQNNREYCKEKLKK